MRDFTAYRKWKAEAAITTNLAGATKSESMKKQRTNETQNAGG